MDNEKTEKETGTRRFRELREFCRILLRVILGREIRKVKITPQRAIQGHNTKEHGVRLDAYIEHV